MAYKMLVKDTVTGACGLADVPCPPAALSAAAPISVNGTVIQLDIMQTFAAFGLKDCDNNVLMTGASLATCADLATAIETAINGLPADVYVNGLSSYNSATNTLTLSMSDGSTVAVDMTGLVNDAVASVAAVPVATDTVQGKVALAVGANYPDPTNDNDAVTPAYLAAAIGAIPASPIISADANNDIIAGTDGMAFFEQKLVSKTEVVQNPFASWNSLARPFDLFPGVLSHTTPLATINNPRLDAPMWARVILHASGSVFGNTTGRGTVSIRHVLQVNGANAGSAGADIVQNFDTATGVYVNDCAMPSIAHKFMVPAGGSATLQAFVYDYALSAITGNYASFYQNSFYDVVWSEA